MKIEIAAVRAAGAAQDQLGCQHTLHLTDAAGRPLGTWVDEQVGELVRVVCANCGKFYGYRREAKPAEEQRRER